MHRVCCCSGCPADCCAFWTCSPTTPINITLSGTSSWTDVCDDGVERILGTAAWTITATMTRSGTDCETYRYSANTCNLVMNWTFYEYTQSIGSVCDAPADPCQYDHCGDCICGPVKREVCRTVVHTFSGTVNGVASPGTPTCIPTTWAGYHVPGAVLTVFCQDSPCTTGCAEPVLLFTPADMCESSSCPSGAGCIDMAYSITCGTVDCCDDDPTCATSGTEPICISCWSMVGRGCLNAQTFDNALRHPLGPQLSGPPFQASPGSWTCAYTYEPPVPLDCQSYTFTTKSCDWCSHTNPDVFMSCYQLDPEAPEGYSLLCEVPPLCCSTRFTQAVSWNLA